MTTDRYGKTIWRDAQGRVQGTATTDRYGKTTYRDSMGQKGRTLLYMFLLYKLVFVRG